ncbi:hypothetical protein BDY19DRAFT_86221 [Irpex rosettiformis]|uniref:Uncharacterized protein n=1 Tax=Irpex rosettiformis TaxID=378272 RepID=A0ACB8U5Y4_9APHY|nr:hypothetical protein BDY19DRAFT_86221 [Irpex rosettiformis]
MNQSCVTLDDLVATTQAYVDAIKRLSNLSMIDTADLKDGTQRRWLEQVDDEIATAACMVVKLGGPNDTTLMLPCQRPELKALYIKYELLKADAVFDFRVSVEAKAAFPDEEPEDVETSVAASNSVPQDPPVEQQHKDDQYIEPNSCDSGSASIHAPANEGLNTPSKPSPPPESTLFP